MEQSDFVKLFGMFIHYQDDNNIGYLRDYIHDGKATKVFGLFPERR
jgi:hypothetical protein